MSITTLSTRGQIVIPKRVRELLRLGPGTRFEVRVSRGLIELVPLHDALLDELAGCFADGPDLLADLADERQEERVRDEAILRS